MHKCSFCRACIDAALPEAGRTAGAQCPACAEAGEAVMLGARPYADRRLQPDVVLAELARKLFPASDPRREEAFRIARVSPGPAQALGCLSTHLCMMRQEPLPWHACHCAAIACMSKLILRKHPMAESVDNSMSSALSLSWLLYDGTPGADACA